MQPPKGAVWFKATNSWVVTDSEATLGEGLYGYDRRKYLAVPC
jgi:hypothetical protein